MMVKSGLDFFYFEIHRAPSEIPANLPGQFSLSGQIFLHWTANKGKKSLEISLQFFIYIFMSEFQNFVLEGPKNVFPEQKELKIKKLREEN